MIFDGFFDKGSKLKMDPFTDMGYGYWKEMDENNQLRSVCKVDDQGNVMEPVISMIVERFHELVILLMEMKSKC